MNILYDINYLTILKVWGYSPITLYVYRLSLRCIHIMVTRVFLCSQQYSVTHYTLMLNVTIISNINQYNVIKVLL